MLQSWSSWKDNNVGRRFLGCPIYPNRGYCKFLEWIDPPLCERATQIILGLLKRLNEQRVEKKNLESINDELEEIKSRLQSANDMLVEENKALKDENRALKEKGKYATTNKCSLFLKVFAMLVAYWLVNVLCNSSSNQKMIA
ncbi:hypothetical protein OROMI_001013 [Orobanche minor]